MKAIHIELIGLSESSKMTILTTFYLNFLLLSTAASSVVLLSSLTSSDAMSTSRKKSAGFSCSGHLKPEVVCMQYIAV